LPVALIVLCGVSRAGAAPDEAGILLAAPATQPAKTADFLRFVEDGAGGRLETADMVLVNDKGVVVRLVSAVHIGEKSYYKSLDESFRARDAVLYEMIKPRDAEAPGPGVRSGSGVSDFQRMLKDTLNLSFQLDEIDYSRPNFVHADLDAETFAQKQQERGESMTTLMLKAMMKSMTNPPPDALAGNLDQTLEEVVRVICRPDGERQIKLFLARNMTQFENDALGLDGPGGSVILTERNKAAVEALEKSLQAGKRDIAIFYGAAHMPDLSKRLQQLGFKPVATEWRMAWDLNIRANEPSAIEKLLLELLRGVDD
jgi:hypothetical protein